MSMSLNDVLAHYKAGDFYTIAHYHVKHKIEKHMEKELPLDIMTTLEAWLKYLDRPANDRRIKALENITPPE